MSATAADDVDVGEFGLLFGREGAQDAGADLVGGSVDDSVPQACDARAGIDEGPVRVEHDIVCREPCLLVQFAQNTAVEVDPVAHQIVGIRVPAGKYIFPDWPCGPP